MSGSPSERVVMEKFMTALPTALAAFSKMASSQRLEDMDQERFDESFDLAMDRAQLELSLSERRVASKYRRRIKA